MKMFLTRLENNSRMIITGDLSQIDLPRGTPSGLREPMITLDVGYVSFSERDVVRHPLVSRIVRAYERKKTPH